MNPPPEFDDQTQERAALHALGLLPSEETAEFEREMWTRPGLRDLVQEMRLGLETVGRTEAKREAPRHLRETLLEQVSNRPASNPPITFPAYLPETPVVLRPTNIVWLPWAVAAAFALLGAMFFFQRNAARTEARAEIAKAAEATRQLGLASSQAEGLNRRLADLEAETAKLRAETSRLAQTQAASWSKLRVASLRTTPSANPASTAGGLVLWDADQGTGMLNIRNLPPAPAGKDYQLWVVDPSQPRPLNGGVFKTNADGTAQVYFRPTSTSKVKADKFAISLEPEGGRPVAEGPIFMAGN
jgi:anti-sigma-K factor RskA